MPDFVEANDFLCRSTILRKVGSHRTSFDPSNREHRASLKKFLETGNWGAVMFYPEYPYTDVPTYVLAKFASHFLKVERKTSAELQFDAARARVTGAPEEKIDTNDLIATTQE